MQGLRCAKTQQQPETRTNDGKDRERNTRTGQETRNRTDDTNTTTRKEDTTEETTRTNQETPGGEREQALHAKFSLITWNKHACLHARYLLKIPD